MRVRVYMYVHIIYKEILLFFFMTYINDQPKKVKDNRVLVMFEVYTRKVYS